MYENIIRFPNNADNAPFALQMCGVSYCDGTYKINRPHSKVCCMEYILAGQGQVQIGDTKFTASAGDIYILPLRENHTYFSDPADPWIKIWFNVSGELVDHLLACYNLDHTYHVTKLPIYPLFREFIDAAANASNVQSAQNTCAGIFLKILQHIYAHVHTPRCTSENLAQRLKKRINNLTDFTCNFDDLLSDLYCTKSHIIRAYKTEFGITPYNDLLNRKLAQAKLLLENSAMPIRSIADTLGFRDAHYFSNFFKKQMKISPAQYRKSRNQ